MGRTWYCLSVVILSVLAALTARADAGSNGVGLSLDRVTFFSENPVIINVFVSASDSSGRPVTGLESNQFHLVEDGEIVKGTLHVAPFVVTDRNLAYVLAIDNSEDLATSLTFVRRAAQGFISEMGFRYPGAVVTYGDHPFLESGPVKDAYRLDQAVRNIRPVAGAPRLSEAMFLSLKTLKDLEFSPGLDRRVLVLLSEGRDDASMFSMKAAADRLMESGITLFVIGYGLRDTPAMNFLADLSLMSGGAFFFASNPSDLEPALKVVTERLKNQYVITYASEGVGQDGESHRVMASVTCGLGFGSDEIRFVSPSRGWTFWMWAISGGVLLLVLSAALFGYGLWRGHLQTTALPSCDSAPGRHLINLRVSQIGVERSAWQVQGLINRKLKLNR